MRELALETAFAFPIHSSPPISVFVGDGDGDSNAILLKSLACDMELVDTVDVCANDFGNSAFIMRNQRSTEPTPEETRRIAGDTIKRLRANYCFEDSAGLFSSDLPVYAKDRTIIMREETVEALQFLALTSYMRRKYGVVRGPLSLAPYLAHSALRFQTQMAGWACLYHVAMCEQLDTVSSRHPRTSTPASVLIYAQEPQFRDDSSFHGSVSDDDAADSHSIPALSECNSTPSRTATGSRSGSPMSVSPGLSPSSGDRLLSTVPGMPDPTTSAPEQMVCDLLGPLLASVYHACFLAENPYASAAEGLQWMYALVLNDTTEEISTQPLASWCAAHRENGGKSAPHTLRSLILSMVLCRKAHDVSHKAAEMVLQRMNLIEKMGGCVQECYLELRAALVAGRATTEPRFCLDGCLSPVLYQFVLREIYAFSTHADVLMALCGVHVSANELHDTHISRSTDAGPQTQYLGSRAAFYPVIRAPRLLCVSVTGVMQHALVWPTTTDNDDCNFAAVHEAPSVEHTEVDEQLLMAFGSKRTRTADTTTSSSDSSGSGGHTLGRGEAHTVGDASVSKALRDAVMDRTAGYTSTLDSSTATCLVAVLYAYEEIANVAAHVAILGTAKIPPSPSELIHPGAAGVLSYILSEKSIVTNLELPLALTHKGQNKSRHSANSRAAVWRTGIPFPVGGEASGIT